MRIKNFLVAALLAGATATGCYESGYATTSGYVVYDEPPPPREEIVTYRPGFFYVHGHWLRDGNRWGWHSGHYERERAGYVYNDGRWERRGRGYVYVDGGWRARSGGVVVRDHRRY
jgi:hypothetical protein